MYKYLLLTSFSRKVRTEFSFRVDIINEKKKTRTDRENEVSKIFIISRRLIGRARKETFKISVPYSEIQPAKLTNHTDRTN